MLRLHCLDIAMIKFVDESGSINYCVCTVLLSCTVRAGSSRCGAQRKI